MKIDGVKKAGAASDNRLSEAQKVKECDYPNHIDFVHNNNGNIWLLMVKLEWIFASKKLWGSREMMEKLPIIVDDGDIFKTLQDIRVRLLDLSKRNRLPNFRHNRFCLRIVDEQPNQVYDYLVRNGRPMIFSPLPQPDEPEEKGQEGKEGQTTELYPDRNRRQALVEQVAAAAGINISEELPRPGEQGRAIEEKHTDNKLQTKLFMPELETRLRRIQSKARSVVEETGTNRLFLAMGFLQCKERHDSNEKYEAPLIMIPVELERGGLDAQTRRYSYKVKYTGKDIISNLSLAEKLKGDDRILPDYNDEEVVISAEEGKKLDPESYFSAINDTISNIQGWEVLRKMVLGFSTSSKSLYHEADKMLESAESFADAEEHDLRTSSFMSGKWKALAAFVVLCAFTGLVLYSIGDNIQRYRKAAKIESSGAQFDLNVADVEKTTGDQAGSTEALRTETQPAGEEILIEPDKVSAETGEIDPETKLADKKPPIESANPEEDTGTDLMEHLTTFANKWLDGDSETNEAREQEAGPAKRQD